VAVQTQLLKVGSRRADVAAMSVATKSTDARPTVTREPAYEPTVDTFAAILRGHVPVVSTIVEVGARDGVETLAFADKFPEAQIYSFECNPQTLPACEHAAAMRSNITLIPNAVAEIEGSLSFFQYGPEVGASSLYKFSADYPLEDRAQNEIKVQATTLRRSMAEHDVDRIDGIWLDIQGGELAALKSLGERIRDVGVIYTEVEFFEVYAGQPRFWQIWWFLHRNGFLLHGFPWRSPYFGDAVFVNRDRLTGKRFGAQVTELRALAQTARSFALALLGRHP
jgi:FkbM family methyltransferase